MSSAAKSSRSRQSVPSGVYQGNGGAAQESGVQLADKLKIFKTENFDPDAYVQSKCQTMNEKVPIYLFIFSLAYWWVLIDGNL